MRLKEKLKNLKNRLTDRHMYSIIVGLIVVAVCIFAYQAKVAADYKTQLHAQYDRAFGDLVQSVSNIETNLAKGAVVTEPKTLMRLSSDIYAEARSAAAELGQLPLSDVVIENTAKYLSQVGDFTSMLSLRYLDSPTISAEERNTMLDLGRYAVTLRDSLYDMQEKLYSGAYQYQSPSHFGDGVAMASGMEQIEEQFRDYPSLIYDGPFSDHMQTKESSLLQNAPELSREEAEKRIPELVSAEREGAVSYDGECGGRVPTYMFSVTPDENDDTRRITLQITKKGGMLLDMLDNRAPNETRISIEDAIKHAADYLQTHGIQNMKDSYYEVKSNIATINFAFSDGDVLCYPDLIKVKIFMDTGEIAGLEASGYIMNHAERTLPSTALSEEDALLRISPVLQVESTRLCVIPTDSGGEIFCREIKGTANDKTFLVYLNAQTGHEEDVLLLLYTEGGMLTI